MQVQCSLAGACGKMGRERPRKFGVSAPPQQMQDHPFHKHGKSHGRSPRHACAQAWKEVPANCGMLEPDIR